MNRFHYHQNFSQAISTSSSSYPITQNETSVTKTAPLNFSFGDSFDSIAVHTKTSTNKKGIWAWDKYRVCLKNKNYSSLQLSFYYTPGCYVSYTNTGNTTISRQTYTNEANISWPTTPTRTGYHFNGWIIDNVLHDPDDPNTSICETGDKDITATGDWTKQYQIIFNKVLSDATFSYTQSNYNKKESGNTITTPTAPTINTHKFIGWSLDSSITSATAKLSGADQNCWTTIPDVADSQVNGSNPTTEGFIINYYAVWQPKYSITYKNGTTTLKIDSYAVEEGNTYTILSSTTNDIQENGVQSLYKDKQFLGWSTDSIATTATYISSDTISNVTADITLYAVWQERDSITIEQILPNSQVTEPATIIVTGAAASNNNTYYFNPSSNISFSVAIKQEHEIYFIDSVTANITTDLITNGNLAADRKTYTSGQITAGTNATAITITIAYIEGLPIFYPNGENDFKRAMCVYWENTRAIGLYYENTRLL